MSATLTQTKNIVYRKKSLGNGDLESDIKKQIKKGKSKALENQLKKVNQTMKQFEKSQKKFIPQSNKKMQNEANLLKKNIKKINKNQKELNKKLAQTQLNSKNPNYFFSKNKHLPNSLREIDDNIELGKLLLKNPDKMTTEEKIYIASFNNKEYELFINYLKMKDRELKWVGNGLGSGHYLEGFISIYRKYGQSENERFASLRRFLKLSYNNEKGKEKNNNTNTNFFQIENMNYGDNATFDNFNNNDYDSFEAQSREMMKQLDALTNKINANKEEIEMQKFKNTNELIHNELDRKRNKVKEDLDNLENMRNNPDKEIDELYQQYIAKNKIGRNKNIEDILLGKKIIDYLDHTTLNYLDFAKRFGENKNLENFNQDLIDLDNAKNKLIQLNILDEEEASSLCRILKTYSGKELTVEFFAKFLENLCNKTREKIEEEKRKKEKKKKKSKVQNFIMENNFKGDNLENVDSDDSDFSYDGENIKVKNQFDRNENLRNKLKGEYFLEFEKAMKNKCATIINKNIKGYLKRKEVKCERIYLNILSKRICKLFKKNYERKMKEKEAAAEKITYLLRKNYWNKKDLKSASQFSSRWLKDKKYISNENKKNISASLIQQKWKEHRKIMLERENLLDEQLLRSKICFICKENKVEYLCKDCENNHYCKDCFRKYHMRGNKRNHNYLSVTDLINRKKNKTKAKIIEENIEIKNYLKENNINLYDSLSNWDLQNNNTITYYHLKDALASEVFQMDKKYQKLILDYALKFVTNPSVESKSKYIISLKFCDELV